MKMLIFCLLSTLAMMGCQGCSTNPVQPITCPIQTTLNADLVSYIAPYCTKSAVLGTMLTTWEAPLNLCPSASKDNKLGGTFGDICLALIPIVEQAGNQLTTLQTLGCDLSKVTSLTQLLTNGCNSIPAAVKMKYYTHK